MKIFRQQEIFTELAVVSDTRLKEAEETMNKVLTISDNLKTISDLKKNLNILEQNLYRYEKVAKKLIKQRQKSRERNEQN